MNVLILGGTGEAARLARELATADDLSATVSLAGRTQRPLPSALPTRTGGFGGVAGLERYLAEHAIGAVIDATHPFAAQMSANAVAACRTSGVPLARLQRAPWEATAADRWIGVADLEEAAEAVQPLGRNIFLTVGAYSLHPFEALTDKHWVVRTIDPPEPPPAFADWTLVQARGPFALDDELALMHQHAVDAVVTKNSGGRMTEAKIDAARALGLPVVMVERPPVPAADAEFDDVEPVIAWLRARRHQSPTGPSSE